LAIGAMGHIAFQKTSRSDVEDLLGMSRLAASVVLAGTQILSQMGKDLDRRSGAELVQYIKVVLNGLRQSFEVSNSNVESLFFNQRLRCCLYRLQRETSKIKGCPVITFAEVVHETDPQCIRYVIRLIHELPNEDIDWSLLADNRELLNEFFTSFLANVEINRLVDVIRREALNRDNPVRSIVSVSEKGSISELAFAEISRMHEIWEMLPIEILEAAAAQNVSFEAMFILKYPQLYRSPAQILSSSDPDDVVQVILELCEPLALPAVIARFPQCILPCVEQWTKSPTVDPFCEELLAVLPAILDLNPEAIWPAIPADRADQFAAIVDAHLCNRINDGKAINARLWKFAQFGVTLRELVIAKEVQIDADQETKERLYQALYETIGALIGHLSSASHTVVTDLHRSYDFLETFFNEFELLDLPEDVSIGFLHDYVSKKFPHFEITVYTRTFEVERMANAVRQFLAGISGQKRQAILADALRETRFTVALLLIITADGRLDLPPNAHFVPFLLHDERYREWLTLSDFGDDQGFSNQNQCRVGVCTFRDCAEREVWDGVCGRSCPPTGCRVKAFPLLPDHSIVTECRAGLEAFS
jgi:hypothetical protein